DGVLRAAVELRVALLTAEPAHFGDGHPVHPELGQRLLDVVQLERLDHRLDLLHGWLSRSRMVRAFMALRYRVTYSRAEASQEKSSAIPFLTMAVHSAGSACAAAARRTASASASTAKASKRKPVPVRRAGSTSLTVSARPPVRRT